MMVLFASFLLQVTHKFYTHGLRIKSNTVRNPSRYISMSTKSDTIVSLTQSEKKTFYITTPIYYVNGEPHLGHAYTSIASDIIARYQTYNSKEVFFLTGTDEHGQKVEQSALNAKQTPIEFADKVSNSFKKLTEVIECSNSDFIRTTQLRHKRAVEHLWSTLEANDQIYLGSYEGWYSIRDEAFYSETELINGKAPTGAPVEWVKEESYFFRLSQYTDKLMTLYSDNPDFIGPKGRRNEVLSFVGQPGGLKDLSISRTTFSWGIPVVKDPKHVVYVWLDALTNYLTAVGYPADDGNNDPLAKEKYNKFWPADLHIVGKDILRFHAIFWPAFLMAANLPLPKRIFAHGWWTRDGEKMSKSLGNVVDPFQLIKWYGVDYVRYFLASEIVFGGDGDFSHDTFITRINTDLSNDIGNLLQRVLTFTAARYDHKIPQVDDSSFTDEDRAILAFTDSAYVIVQECMEQQNLKGMSEAVVSIAKQGNKYIDIQAPWKMHKIDPVRCGVSLFVLAECLRRVGILLQPIMPNYASKLLNQLSVPDNERLFSDLQTIKTRSGTVIPEPYPMFPKLDISIIPTEELKKQNSVINSAEVIESASAISISSMSVDELMQSITSTGNLIRDMKVRKASKDELKPFVDSLLNMKSKLKQLKPDA